MTDLMNFYRKLLASVDCEVDHTTNVIRFKLNTVESGHIDEPVILKGDRLLVLPTKEVLMGDIDWKKIVAFHPVCESALGGQSEVLNALLTLINSKVARSTMILATAIADLALNTEAQESLKINQAELLEPLKLDKACHTLLSKIASTNTQFTGERPLVSLHLHRGGEIGGVKYARICTVAHHFNANPKTICGCTPGSPNANKTVRKIFEMVLPTDTEYGTNSANQPYLRVLLEAYYRVLLRINTVIKILGKFSVIPQIDTSWYDTLPTLQKLYKQDLPQSLSGNVGDAINSKNASKDPALGERSKKFVKPLSEEPMPDTETLQPPPVVGSPFGLSIPASNTPSLREVVSNRREPICAQREPTPVARTRRGFIDQDQRGNRSRFNSQNDTNNRLDEFARETVRGASPRTSLGNRQEVGLSGYSQGHIQLNLRGADPRVGRRKF